jgi:hypothetical protein
MTALTTWLKHLSGKFYALVKGKNGTNSKKQETNSNVPEKWREILNDNKYTYWNEEFQRPVSLAIKPGTYMEYLWKHPEEVRKILLEHGIDPDDDNMLGVINIEKKDSSTKKNT